jgi:hypothetical protein
MRMTSIDQTTHPAAVMLSCARAGILLLLFGSWGPAAARLRHALAYGVADRAGQARDQCRAAHFQALSANLQRGNAHTRLSAGPLCRARGSDWRSARFFLFNNRF